MKTPEDEAFDDIERKQREWGGGFPAKRKMAADKLQEFCTCHETHPMECQGCRANRLAQPVQEPVANSFEEYCQTLHPLWNTHISRTYAEQFFMAGQATQPAQEQRPWVGLTDADIERIKLMTYEKETNADGEEQEAVNIDWLIKTTEHFCKEKNT